MQRQTFAAAASAPRPAAGGDSVRREPFANPLPPAAAAGRRWDAALLIKRVSSDRQRINEAATMMKANDPMAWKQGLRPV